MTQEQRNAEIRKAMAAYEAANSTPELARAGLLRMGIYTSDGRLRPEYGGDADEVKREA